MFLLLFSSMVVAIGLVGCGDDDEGQPLDASCFDYGSFQVGTEEVSLRRDVMPVLQASCTFGNSCHGTISGSQGLVYLGPVQGVPPSIQHLQAVLDQTLDVMPVLKAGMPLITAGNAEQSFLMHKADNTLACGKLECAANDACGAPMPYQRDLASAEDRNKIRRWIAQGAKLN
ncbi:uncharacterized protein CMC5_068480 [Chondromyces crocatus]|uniref:Cytochrome C Planctomycete-type domain-containing protein n=2 Tax=Chondromyces crocatus TaxID=52 RepID=A0A0K1EP51_CHOCO|nr:uncharacterized protein CMC5_068480 [Chondromyces crocatus]